MLVCYSKLSLTEETAYIINKAQEGQSTHLENPTDQTGKERRGQERKKKKVTCLPSVSLASKQVTRHMYGSKVNIIVNLSKQQWKQSTDIKQINSILFWKLPLTLKSKVQLDYPLLSFLDQSLVKYLWLQTVRWLINVISLVSYWIWSPWSCVIKPLMNQNSTLGFFFPVKLYWVLNSKCHKTKRQIAITFNSRLLFHRSI